MEIGEVPANQGDRGGVSDGTLHGFSSSRTSVGIAMLGLLQYEQRRSWQLISRTPSTSPSARSPSLRSVPDGSPPISGNTRSRESRRRRGAVSSLQFLLVWAADATQEVGDGLGLNRHYVAGVPALSENAVVAGLKRRPLRGEARERPGRCSRLSTRIVMLPLVSIKRGCPDLLGRARRPLGAGSRRRCPSA